jgi:hypothetical protein
MYQYRTGCCFEYLYKFQDIKPTKTLDYDIFSLSYTRNEKDAAASNTFQLVGDSSVVVK